jgi:hypothetical protein
MNQPNFLHVVQDEENLIDRLAKELQVAKEAEDAANAHRLSVEERIINALGVESEGSTTFKGNEFKITTVGKINRNLDVTELERIWEILPTPAKDCIRYKPEIIKKELDGLLKHNPAAFTVLSIALTEKPAKPSVAFAEIKK